MSASEFATIVDNYEDYKMFTVCDCVCVYEQYDSKDLWPDLGQILWSHVAEDKVFHILSTPDRTDLSTEMLLVCTVLSILLTASAEIRRPTS